MRRSPCAGEITADAVGTLLNRLAGAPVVRHPIGELRELFELGPDRLLFVTSDRISAYDVVMPQVPASSALDALWSART